MPEGVQAGGGYDRHSPPALLKPAPESGRCGFRVPREEDPRRASPPHIGAGLHVAPGLSPAAGCWICTPECLGYAIAQLAAEKACLGRRRDELADWLARCRQRARDLRFRPRAWCTHPPIIDPAELERRLNERHADKT